MHHTLLCHTCTQYTHMYFTTAHTYMAMSCTVIPRIHIVHIHTDPRIVHTLQHLYSTDIRHHTPHTGTQAYSVQYTHTHTIPLCPLRLGSPAIRGGSIFPRASSSAFQRPEGSHPVGSLCLVVTSGPCTQSPTVDSHKEGQVTWPHPDLATSLRDSALYQVWLACSTQAVATLPRPANLP